MGDITPGQLAQAGQASEQRSLMVSISGPASRFCFEFLPCLPSSMEYSLRVISPSKRFSPLVAFGHGVGVLSQE